MTLPFKYHRNQIGDCWYNSVKIQEYLKDAIGSKLFAWKNQFIFVPLRGNFSLIFWNGEKILSWATSFQWEKKSYLYFSGLKMWYHLVKKIFSTPYTQKTMFTWWYKGSTKINKILIMLSLWRFWCMLCLFCHTYKTDNFIQLKLFFMKICWRNLYKLSRWVRRTILDKNHIPRLID